jgi:nucleoid-associated protein YgaU
MATNRSRYAAQPVIPVPQPDGTVRRMSAPRVVPAPATRGTYDVHAGDRLDLMGLAATGDSTQWWRLADANPSPDATELERPGATIDLPER